MCLIINYLERRSLLTACGIAVLLTMIFFMHAMAFLFAVMVYTACVLFDMWRQRSWRRMALHAGLCLPGAFFFLLWYAADSRDYSGPSMAASLLKYYQHTFWVSFWQRGGVFVHDNFRLSGTVSGYGAAALFSLITVVYAVAPMRHMRERKRPAGTTGLYCMIIFAACAFACVLLMPEALPGFSFLYQRFSVLLFLGIIVLGSIGAPPVLPTPVKTCLCVLVALHAVLWFHSFREFDRENSGFDKTFFSGCSAGNVVGGLIYDSRFRDVSMYENFPDYYMVWGRCASTTRLADARSFIIRRRVGTDVLPEYIIWLGKKKTGFYDGRYATLDYLLVRGEIPMEARRLLQHFALIRQRGAWLLYANSKRIELTRDQEQ
jgi:hypothetical protein